MGIPVYIYFSFFFFKLMETGVNGASGALAQRHANMGNNIENENATRQLQNMAGRNALDNLLKPNLATKECRVQVSISELRKINALSCSKWYSSYAGADLGETLTDFLNLSHCGNQQKVTILPVYTIQGGYYGISSNASSSIRQQLLGRFLRKRVSFLTDK